MRLVCVVIIFSVFASVSFATDWRQMDSGNAFDAETIDIVKGGNIKYWVRYVLPVNEVLKIASTNQQYYAYAYTVAFDEADCKSRLLKTNAIYSYSNKGSVINSNTSYDRGFEPVVPGSIGESDLKFICSLLDDPQPKKTRRKR
ncbi:MAG: surface-adhesin E family protein [Desulfuromonadales bacterium]